MKQNKIITACSEHNSLLSSKVQSTLATLIFVDPTTFLAKSSHVGANLLQCPHLIDCIYKY